MDTVFISIELTGKLQKIDRIIKLNLVKYDTNFKIKKRIGLILNPEIEVYDEIVSVLGLADMELSKLPTFKSEVRSILGFIEGCNIVGYDIQGIKLDIFNKQVNECDIEYNIYNHTILDVLNIEEVFDPRSITGLSKKYNIDKNDTDEEVDLLASIFQRQIQAYKFNAYSLDLYKDCTSADSLGYIGVDKFLRIFDGRICFARGRNITKPIVNHPDYCQWVLGENFGADTKYVIKRELGLLGKITENSNVLSRLKKRKLNVKERRK